MPQKQQNVLQPNDLYDFYAGLIKDAAEKQNIQISNDQLALETKRQINIELQKIKSDICSLNSDRFMSGYAQFVWLINNISHVSPDFSDIPNKETLKQIRNYINEVPPLMQVYDTILLYRDYERLVGAVNTTDFKAQRINQFEHRVQKISSHLSDEDNNSLLDGVVTLHNLYTNNILQKKKKIATQQEIYALPEDYLDTYYFQMALNMLQQNSKEIDNGELTQTAQKLKSEDLQQMQDDFCSFDEKSSNEAYAKLLAMTGFDSIIQECNLSEDEISLGLKSYVQNVPELAELHDLMQLSTQITNLNKQAKLPTATTIYHEDLLEFRKQILSHRESSKELHLSDANLANFEYNLISLCQKCDDPSFELYKNMCRDVLYLSDNPQHIAEIYNLFTPPENNEVKPFRPSHSVNEIVKNTCNRILENKKDCLSQQDFYNLYSMLGHAYRRTQNTAGFIQLDKRKHMEESNTIAFNYFLLACNYAPTPSDGETAAQKAYDINPTKYSLQLVAKKFPIHESRRYGFELTRQPYGKL